MFAIRGGTTRHIMLTQRTIFVLQVMGGKGTVSRHFVTHAVPPLVCYSTLCPVYWKTVLVAMTRPFTIVY